MAGLNLLFIKMFIVKHILKKKKEIQLTQIEPQTPQSNEIKTLAKLVK